MDWRNRLFQINLFPLLIEDVIAMYAKSLQFHLLFYKIFLKSRVRKQESLDFGAWVDHGSFLEICVKIRIFFCFCFDGGGKAKFFWNSPMDMAVLSGQAVLLCQFNDGQSQIMESDQFQSCHCSCWYFDCCSWWYCWRKTSSDQVRWLARPEYGKKCNSIKFPKSEH